MRADAKQGGLDVVAAGLDLISTRGIGRCKRSSHGNTKWGAVGGCSGKVLGRTPFLIDSDCIRGSVSTGRRPIGCITNDANSIGCKVLAGYLSYMSHDSPLHLAHGPTE